MLVVENDKVLIISEYGIDCKKYNKNLESSWEKCTLRRWLNNEFLKLAFNIYEQNVIEITNVIVDENFKTNTNQDNDTHDKVFLLSVKEVENYLKFNKYRICIPTQLAIVNGAMKDRNNHWWWWLRSAGSFSDFVTYVDTDGNISYWGDYVNYDDGMVRPALWINLKKYSTLHYLKHLLIQDNLKEINVFNIKDISEDSGEFIDDSIFTVENRKVLFNFLQEKTLSLEKFTFTTGSVVNFGQYKINKRDRKPIEWKVLAVDNDKALLISSYGLDCEPYNWRFINTSWEECSLRTWLNTFFLNTAFNSAEKDGILLSDVTADNNPECETAYQGNNTKDKIFLLSAKEVEKYFYSDEERECEPTEFAFAQGAYNGWWLRSLGACSKKATCVSLSFLSSYSYYDELVDALNYAVRPALWTNISAYVSSKLIYWMENNPEISKIYDNFFTLYNLISIKAEVGSIIKLGSYLQNSKAKRNSNPIEWLVLAVENEKILVISRYGLEYKPYNEKLIDTSWEECTLRTWLNNDFLNAAFNDMEQSLIILSDVVADENPDYKNTYQGHDVKDKIFLLSIKEIEKYLSSKENRRCKHTIVAVNNGNQKNNDDQCCWWSRSMGYSSKHLSVITNDGSIRYSGFSLSNDYAVRPALWIKFK